MGQTIASGLHGLPTVIIQEGGYLMETIGEAASNNVVLGYLEESQKKAELST